MSVQISSNHVNVDVEQLVSDHLHLIRFTIQKFYPYITNIDMIRELESVGRIGLVLAARRYEDKKGFAFSTYAVYRIRGEIASFLRRQSKYQGVTSLDREIGEDGFSLYDVISDDSALFESKVVQKVEANRLLSHLNKTQRELLERYYGLGGRVPQSMRQIAKEFGITHRTVSKLIESLHEKLRNIAGMPV